MLNERLIPWRKNKLWSCKCTIILEIPHDLSLLGISVREEGAGVLCVFKGFSSSLVFFFFVIVQQRTVSSISNKKSKMEKKVKEEKTNERKTIKKKKKDHNSTWHTFQRVLKKTTTFVHIRTIYSYSYIYAYKTPKNGGSWSLPGFPVAEADSEQCFF